MAKINRQNAGMYGVPAPKATPTARQVKNPIATPKPSPDDKILRTMPITETQLGQIKKHYGI